MDSNTTLKITLGTILIVGIIAIGLSMNHTKKMMIHTILV
jgi:hypothetical protein